MRKKALLLYDNVNHTNNDNKASSCTLYYKVVCPKYLYTTNIMNFSQASTRGVL